MKGRGPWEVLVTPRSKSLPLLSCRPRAAMASLRDKALMRRRRYAQRRVVCAAVRPCWGRCQSPSSTPMS